jgi:hypothetical protein
MNRILRNDGTWYKRNGPKGSGVSWFWDYINNPLTDTYDLNSAVTEFSYTPAGNVPVGAQTDDYNLNIAIPEFLYLNANLPNGVPNDTLTIGLSVEGFSYA